MTNHTPDEATVLDCFLDGAAGNFIAEDFASFLANIRKQEREVVASEIRDTASTLDALSPTGVNVSSESYRIIADLLTREATS